MNGHVKSFSVLVNRVGYQVSDLGSLMPCLDTADAWCMGILEFEPGRRYK